jgi:putative toxin-antitoxin system antitoxin component (TIGR02293 family)
MKTSNTINLLQNPLELIELSRKGLNRGAIDAVGKQLEFSDREMARILNISERTLHRYPIDKQLDTSCTERLLKLMLLYQYGEDVFSELEDFKLWMRQSMRIFGDKSGVELLDTITGFEVVTNTLKKIEFGVYS